MPQLRPSIAKEKVVKRSHSSSLCFLGVRGGERVSSLALEPHIATMNFHPAVVASCSPERSLDPAFVSTCCAEALPAGGGGGCSCLPA